MTASHFSKGKKDSNVRHDKSERAGVRSVETMKAYLDTILLISSLLLGFAANFLNNFTYRDIEAADERWYQWCIDSNISNAPEMSNANDGYCAKFPIELALQGKKVQAMGAWQYLPSADLAYRIMWTYSALGSSVLVGTVCYLNYIYWDPPSMTTKRALNWWKWFQWPVHLAMFLFILGVGFFSFTNAIIYRITYPDNNAVSGVQGNAWTTAGSPWRIVDIYQWIMAGTGLVVAFISIAFAAIYTAKRKLKIKAEFFNFEAETELDVSDARAITMKSDVNT